MAKRSASAPRLAPLQRIAAHPVRVLVVAAEDVWRRATASSLADQGFDVREAGNADSAGVQLAQQWPEVLVLDLPTPDMESHPEDTGIQTLRALAERPHRPGMVAFAVDPNSSTAQAARELGAVAVMHRRAELAKLPVGASLGWKVCSAWHWHRRQQQAISGTIETT